MLDRLAFYNIVLTLSTSTPPSLLLHTQQTYIFDSLVRQGFETRYSSTRFNVIRQEKMLLPFTLLILGFFLKCQTGKSSSSTVNLIINN